MFTQKDGGIVFKLKPEIVKIICKTCDIAPAVAGRGQAQIIIKIFKTDNQVPCIFIK